MDIDIKIKKVEITFHLPAEKATQEAVEKTVKETPKQKEKQTKSPSHKKNYNVKKQRHAGHQLGPRRPPKNPLPAKTQLILDHRIKKDVSQKELGKAVGVNASFISSIERNYKGRKWPNDKFEKACAFLQIPQQEINKANGLDEDKLIEELFGELPCK